MDLDFTETSEVDVAAGVGNSITASNATLVRVLNPSGTATVVHVTDPAGLNEYSGIGSFTLGGNAVEYVEKVLLIPFTVKTCNQGR